MRMVSCLRYNHCSQISRIRASICRKIVLLLDWISHFLVRRSTSMTTFLLGTGLFVLALLLHRILTDFNFSRLLNPQNQSLLLALLGRQVFSIRAPAQIFLQANFHWLPLPKIFRVLRNLVPVCLPEKSSKDLVRKISAGCLHLSTVSVSASRLRNVPGPSICSCLLLPPYLSPFVHKRRQEHNVPLTLNLLYEF